MVVFREKVFPVETNEMSVGVPSGSVVPLMEGSVRASDLSGLEPVGHHWATTPSTAHPSHELPPLLP